MYTVFGWKTEGANHSKDLGIDGKTILKFILGKYSANVWTGCVWPRIGIGDGLF
jgi:hypothetical protein